MIKNNNPFNENLKNPLPYLWDGLCTIQKYEEVYDEETAQTVEKLTTFVENEPCRLSHENNTVSDSDYETTSVYKAITLIIRPDIEIPPGCVIEVTQYGVTRRYKNSSIPSVYFTHQEVQLDNYENKV